MAAEAWGLPSGMPAGRVFDAERGDRFDAFVRRWLEAGSPVAEPRAAATVMLVRDTDLGPEVFVQERAATMAFAPAMVVFPGGRVDAADADATVDEDVLRGLVERMGVDRELARAVIGAALREVQEECGVRLPASALRPRARWLTPVMEPRRYDTWFFAARMPAGQVAVGATRETTSDHWGRAEVLLAAGRAGRLRLMPPTIVALEQFGAFGSVAEFLADEPNLALVEPRLVETPAGYALHSDLP